MGINQIFVYGKLTIKCFVSGHGTTTVAVVKDIKPEAIEKHLNDKIQAYLKRCRYKDCERWFSWKYETY